MTGAAPTVRQFVKFTFYQADASWRLLTPVERERAREELCRAVESFGDRMLVRSYSLSGLRGDADFLLWLVSEQLEDFQEFATQVSSSAMGPYLRIAYSYLAQTRRSIYVTPKDSQEVDGRLRIHPSSAKYLFVYPFVKTRSWYELPKDVRQQMMDEHIAIGRKYPSVKLNTTYSYGIDDQEFVVSFETDSPSDFLDLVLELRETKASMYTLRDTPTFTCVAMPLREALLVVGAPGDTQITAPADFSRDGWQPVAKLDELSAERGKVVHVAGEQVALFSIGGRVYAVANRCSHANGPLSEGRIDGTAVTCPWHESQFDLETGQPLRTPAQRPVPVYDAKVEDGVVLVVARPSVVQAS
jgi:chlorite dismutase